MPPKSDPNKPKGRTSAYAYFVASKRKENKDQGKKLDFSEFAKECSEAWKKTTEEKKGEYKELALKDKKRYDDEMSEYKSKHAGGSSASKRSRGARKKKDPNAPKRPLSAFLFFSRDRRPDIKSDHPNYSIGEIAKELGKEWQSMDGDEKAPFEKMTQKDRDRYEEEKRNYVPEDADDGEEEEDEYDD